MRMFYEYQGKKYLLKELAELAGCSRQAMNNRLCNSKTIEAAIHYKQFKIDGVYYTIKEMARIAGITYDAMLKRMQIGKVDADLLKPKKRA